MERKTLAYSSQTKAADRNPKGTIGGLLFVDPQFFYRSIMKGPDIATAHENRLDTRRNNRNRHAYRDEYLCLPAI